MLGTASCLLALAATAAATGPVIRPLATPVRGVAVRATGAGATSFNAPGHVVLGWTDTTRREDVLVECAGDGSTVWECRLTPGGRMTAFARLPDGLTLVALASRGRDPQVLALSPAGTIAGGWTAGWRRARDRRPVLSLAPLAGGTVLAATAGWAGAVSPAGRVLRALARPGLKGAWPARDGRWLVALADPPGFGRWDGTAFEPIPLQSLCLIWDAARIEEPAPGRFRFTGCFCQSLEPATRGGRVPRKTLEVVDTDASWTLRWTFVSPKALRIDEFGTERCATFTRQVVTLGPDRMLLLDGTPDACHAVELAPSGARGRVWVGTAAGADRGMFGETACPLVGAQVLLRVPEQQPVRESQPGNGL